MYAPFQLEHIHSIEYFTPPKITRSCGMYALTLITLHTIVHNLCWQSLQCWCISNLCWQGLQC